MTSKPRNDQPQAPSSDQLGALAAKLRAHTDAGQSAALQAKLDGRTAPNR